MEYRRAQISGGRYFFTLALANPNSDLLITHVDILREAIKIVKERRPFIINAMVILPDHLHALWALPQND